MNPPGVRFDVEAGASEASGRARVIGLIGLLMRPCKAKGVIGLVAIHVEPGVSFGFLTFFPSFILYLFIFSILRTKKAGYSCHMYSDQTPWAQSI